MHEEICLITLSYINSISGKNFINFIYNIIHLFILFIHFFSPSLTALTPWAMRPDRRLSAATLEWAQASILIWEKRKEKNGENYDELNWGESLFWTWNYGGKAAEVTETVRRWKRESRHTHTDTHCHCHWPSLVSVLSLSLLRQSVSDPSVSRAQRESHRQSFENGKS